MRKFAITVISAVAFTSAAHAEPFSGGYVGAEIIHDNYELDGENLDLGTGDLVTVNGLSGNGVAGGVYAGYDFLVSDTFFVGAEGNLSYSDAHMSFSATDGINSIETKLKARETYGLSARAGGKINDNTGIYARLGWLTTKFESSELQNGVEAFADGQSEDAFVYGAGLESYLNPNASIRIEYSISDYGNFSDGPLGAINNKVSAGFSWHF